MMQIVNLYSLPWEEYTSPGGRFQGFAKQISEALGAQPGAPLDAGGHPFDLEYGRLLAGKSACPFHSHRSQWELFVIIQGSGLVRHGSRETVVRAGDAVLHPPGEAHQLTQTGAEELHYLLIADNPPVDVFHYPDSGKWGFRPRRRIFRLSDAHYWDGEEEGAEQLPFHYEPEQLDAGLARFVSIDSLPWQRRNSPTGRFDSTCRNISVALGGVVDTGPWGGGHPFDLQLRRVAPGAAICPFHAHSQQWELFLALAGVATVRSGEERHTVRPGDVFLQPPGTPHQLISTGSEPFDCYILTDNPPAESIFYPDSGKYMIKPSRQVFRMTEVDYFEGEDG